jgi:hypothetical protein
MQNIETLDPFQSSISDRVPYNQHRIGPSRVQYKKIKASSCNTSGASFTINVPNNTTLIDRRIYIQLATTVTGNGAAVVANSAPRAYPVNSIIQNANVSINGTVTSSQPSEMIYPFQRYISYDDNTVSNYATPTQLDPVADLTNVPPTTGYQSQSTVGRVGAANVANSFYGVDNPQSPFLTTTAVSGRDQELPRAMFPKTTAGNVDTYLFTECLLNGALADPDEQTAFSNVNVIQVDLNFHSDRRGRMWSHTANIADVDCVIDFDPNETYVIVRFMTPSIPQALSVIRSPLKRYLIKSQTIGNVASVAGPPVVFGSATATFSNLIMNTIPTHIYIFARLQNNTFTNDDGIFFLRPDSLSLNVGTTAGLFSGMDTRMLYQMSKDNGLKQLNYIQWHSTLGGVICIDVAKDIGLKPGQNKQIAIDFTFTGTTVTPTTKAFDLYMIAVQEGMLEITPDSCNSVLGFSVDDELNVASDAQDTQMIMLPEATTGKGFQSHGGKFSFGQFLRGAKTVLGVAAPALSGIASMTPLGSMPGVSQGLSVLNAANRAANGGSMRVRRAKGGGQMFG